MSLEDWWWVVIQSLSFFLHLWSRFFWRPRKKQAILRSLRSQKERCLESPMNGQKSSKRHFVHVLFLRNSPVYHRNSPCYEEIPRTQKFPTMPCFFRSLRMDFLVHSVCSFMAGLGLWEFFFLSGTTNWAMKKPGCLGWIADEILPSYVGIPMNQPVKMESKSFFFSWLTWRKSFHGQGATMWKFSQTKFRWSVLKNITNSPIIMVQWKITVIKRKLRLEMNRFPLPYYGKKGILLSDVFSWLVKYYA